MQLNIQREEMKQRDREIQEKSSEIDGLHQQLERLKNSGRESRRRQKVAQNQIRTLCEERADFLAQLQDQHREIVLLRKQLGIAEKENEDLIAEDDDPHRPRFSTEELKEVLAERNELKCRINDLEEELMACKPIPENSYDSGSNAADDDPPVQGPLPYEPDDAPWKKNSESGIRKL